MPKAYSPLFSPVGTQNSCNLWPDSLTLQFKIFDFVIDTMKNSLPFVAHHHHPD
jgi:hypothetical protein